MNISPLQLARRFIGIVQEKPGSADDPLILAMLQLCDKSVQHDEIPWCSAFVNFIAFLLDLPRSHSLAARSWLKVGNPVDIDYAVGYSDVVILRRGEGSQPGPEVLNAPGHVGFFVRLADNAHSSFYMLGGNQSNTVSIELFPVSRILGIRRLWNL